jgi:predicted nucleotide-binding protein
LTPDDSTSLTDIMTFLDANPPAAEQPQPPKEKPVADPKRVFVIYGQNTDAHHQMLMFLRALKLDPRDFDEVARELGTSPSIFDVVLHGMSQAAGVVALFTPDEWAVLRPEHDPERRTGDSSRRWQARPNVIFEAGMALGTDRKRTILVKLGPDVSLFSDVSGMLYVALDNTPKKRNALRDMLEAAGCTPDMKTSAHLSVESAGDFESCVQFAGSTPPGEPFQARPRKGK